MLPPIVKLSKIARHTLNILTSQMPIIHEPTFRLDRLHAFTAFSMATIGTKNYIEKMFEKQDPCPNDPWHYVPSIVRTEVSPLP